MNSAPFPPADRLPKQAAPLLCQACGCGTVFAVSEPQGQRPHAFFLRCCQCGQERRDMAMLDWPTA